MATTVKRSAKSVRSLYEIPLFAVVIIWAIFIVGAVIPSLHLQSYGIHPRSIDGLIGILFAPLLHASLYHAAANTVPLFVLLMLLLVQAGSRWVGILAVIWLGTGIGTWAMGRAGAVHIGASGIIYGLLTYLITAGFYQRDWKSIVIGLAVLIGYGGLLIGVVPGHWYISWESHLCGAISGVLVASSTRKRSR